MPTYAFEVMSQQQAAGFAAADSLIVATPLSVPTAVGVSFSGANVTLTLAGRSLTFGAAFTSQVHELRPAGEAAIVIGSTGGDVIHGLTRGDVFSLLPGDALYGNAGDDTLDGAGGNDTITGGPGADLFVFGTNGGNDVVTDFEPIDRIAVPGPLPAAFTYVEATFATESAAASFGIGEVNAGRADVVVAQVGPNLRVFMDAIDRNTTTVTFTLANVDLSAIDRSNFVTATVTAAPPPSPVAADAPPPLIAAPPTAAPVAPLAPPASGDIRGMGGAVTGNMDQLHFASFSGVTPAEQTTEVYRLNAPAANLLLGGSGLTYDSHGVLTEGQVGFVRFTNNTGPETSFQINVFTPGVRTTSFGFWVANDDGQAAFATILVNDDTLSGGAGADLIRGFGGADFIVGHGGGDTLWGGTGNDILYAFNTPGAAPGPAGATYLRGEEGNDWIGGGDGFDDANGNQGDDTITTGAGDDYCVGGKDSDLLFGDGGYDLVYGNIGNDTCEGGDGNDIVRGGQDNDVVRGGNGDDFVSGDKGDDTMSGGTGADIFHTFGDAGIDKVLDFNFAEGDRVQLDPGTVFTVAQDGNDTVITMVGGGKMTLVGVPFLSLSPGWIFGA